MLKMSRGRHWWWVYRLIMGPLLVLNVFVFLIMIGWDFLYCFVWMGLHDCERVNISTFFFFIRHFWSVIRDGSVEMNT